MILTLLIIFRRNKMKKQLLIAAVAATMGTAAIADISITGAGMAKFVTVDTAGTGTDSHTTSQEMDLKVTGKHGDTTVVMAFDMDGSNGVAAGDQYISTKIGDVTVKMGDFIGGKSTLTKRSGRADKISASMAVGPAKITYENNATNTAGAVYVAADLGGVAATYKQKDGSNEVHLSGSVSGIAVTYRGIDKDAANSDMSLVTVSGTAGGIALTYADASTDSSANVDGDGFFGDLNGATGTGSAGAGADVTGISASMDLAGNAVTFKSVDIDGTSAQDKTINSITAVRALASGTTLTTKYTMTDVVAANTDTDTLEVKLSVSF
jgi:hypothetical protein